MTLYYPANARSPQQAADMAALEAAGTCIFCDPDDEQPILHETAHWYVTPNEYPYEGVGKHLLLVPRVHVVELHGLPLVARGDFWCILDQVRQKHMFPAYILKVRNGDPEKTGGTVAHLHIHLTSRSAPSYAVLSSTSEKISG